MYYGTWSALGRTSDPHNRSSAASIESSSLMAFGSNRSLSVLVALTGYDVRADLGLASVRPVGWLEPLKMTRPEVMYWSAVSQITLCFLFKW